MKYKLRFIVSFLSVLIAAIACAQKQISVAAVSKKMSRGEQPGFQTTIPEGKLKEITTLYKKQLEQNTKIDAKEIGGELVTYGAVNKNFSSKPFTVFSKFLETPEGVDMTVFVTEDSLNFISEKSDADKLMALKKSIRDFAVTAYNKILSKKHEVETDKLNKLKKELANKVEDESDNMKDIGKMQREIENNTTKIESNKSALVSLGDQVNRQQRLVNEAGDKKSSEYQAASKNLKSYQDEKKSKEKETEKMGRKIDGNKADIKQLEIKNEDLQKQQAAIKEKVDAQEAVVKAIEQKRNGIRY